MNVRPANASDLAAVAALLAKAGLSTVGLDPRQLDLIVAEENGAVVGAAAIEAHSGHGLLRSVVVDEQRRGGAVGTRLVAEAVTAARRDGLRDLWLLTETAEGFFSSLGWTTSVGNDMPSAIRLSPEYTAHCSESAAVMVRDLSRL
jgi:amino-acid N-acetyltransferase